MSGKSNIISSVYCMYTCICVLYSQFTEPPNWFCSETRIYENKHTATALFTQQQYKKIPIKVKQLSVCIRAHILYVQPMEKKCLAGGKKCKHTD